MRADAPEFIPTSTSKFITINNTNANSKDDVKYGPTIEGKVFIEGGRRNNSNDDSFNNMQKAANNKKYYCIPKGKRWSNSKNHHGTDMNCIKVSPQNITTTESQQQSNYSKRYNYPTHRRKQCPSFEDTLKQKDYTNNNRSSSSKNYHKIGRQTNENNTTNSNDTIHNSTAIVTGSSLGIKTQKRRRKRQGKKNGTIPLLAIKERNCYYSDMKNRHFIDNFPPLRDPTSATSLSTTDTIICSCSNNDLKPKQQPGWSTVVTNAHLDCLHKINQQQNNIIDKEEKPNRLSYLTWKTKQQSIYDDDRPSLYDGDHDEDEKEVDTTTQGEPNNNRSDDPSSLTKHLLLLDDPSSLTKQLLLGSNNNTNTKRVNSEKLKQRWVQIWNSKFPTTTDLSNSSSFHRRKSSASSSSSSSSTSSLIMDEHNEWNSVLNNSQQPEESDHNHHCFHASCDNEDDDDDDDSSISSSTSIHSTTSGSSSCSTDSSDSLFSVISIYTCQPFPTHAAILDDNILALRHLLRLPKSLAKSDHLASWDDLSYHPPPLMMKRDDEVRISQMKPIHLAIILDKYPMVKAIVEHESKSNSNGESQSINALNNFHQTPLIVALCLRLEPYVSLLLTNGAKLNIKDSNGDTPLHHCCRTSFLSGLELIFSSTRNRNTNNNLPRILCSRNGRGQTPFHVACAAGDNAVVEKLLSTCSASVTIKAMQICDDFGRTPLLVAVENGAVDTVESLVLWRRNQQRFSKQKIDYETVETSSSACCPLLLAIQNENIEMLRILLELGGDLTNSRIASSTLDNALFHAATQCKGPFQHDAIRLLVEAGANPFGPKDSFEYNSLLGSSISKSVVTLLARCGDTSSLKVTLDSFLLASKEFHAQRRQDPYLRNRPTSYFETLEKKEDETIRAGMRDALVESLLTSWTNNGPKDVGGCRHLTTSAFLLKSGAVLNETGFSRLVAGFSSARGGKRFISTVKSCRTKYIHLVPTDKQRNTSKQLFDRELSMGYWSNVLSSIPWLWSYYDHSTTTNIYCGWWREQLRAPTTTASIDMECLKRDVCFLVIGRNRYMAHKSILSAKSKKLAAAFRFSSLKHQHLQKDDGCNNEVALDISLYMLGFLMQHCYHGSIFFGLSDDIHACSQQLIELSWIADEYICPTLLVECEMRLISLSGAKKSSCFCWCCCSKVQRSMDREHDSCSNVKSASSASTIECEYTVSIPSIAALMNNLGTAVEILALCQQLAPYHNGYEVAMFGIDSTNCHFSHPIYQPFMVAKILSLKAILLCGFCQDYHHLSLMSFFNHASDMIKTKEDEIYTSRNDDLGTIALLEYCLEEISKSFLIK